MYIHLDHLVFLHLLGLDENKDIQMRAEIQIALGDFRSHDKIGHSDAKSVPSLKHDSIGQDSNKAAKLNLSITSPRGKGGGVYHWTLYRILVDNPLKSTLKGDKDYLISIP